MLFFACATTFRGRTPARVDAATADDGAGGGGANASAAATAPATLELADATAPLAGGAALRCAAPAALGAPGAAGRWEVAALSV